MRIFETFYCLLELLSNLSKLSLGGGNWDLITRDDEGIGLAIRRSLGFFVYGLKYFLIVDGPRRALLGLRNLRGLERVDRGL
jgi:hypothetical protein